MAASICHRATGVGLYAGALLLTLWLFAVAVGGPAFDAAARLLASPFGVFVLFGFAWAIAFHTLNGLRHLYWDAGRGLAVKHATQTAWLVFTASALIAVFVVATGLASRGAHLP
jgi:succinate dehydrogenase / fumarate reductase cytochrome b subunit